MYINTEKTGELRLENEGIQGIQGTQGINICREKIIINDEVQEHTIASNTQLNSNINPMLRIISNSFFTPVLYAVSSILLILFLIIIFYTYVLRLKVETAVVGSPIETMIAPVSGYITDVFVASGEEVKKGTPLVKIENMDLERELQLARVQLDESKVTIEYYHQLLFNEQQRLKIYKKIGNTRVISAQTLVNRSKLAMTIAQHNVNRFTVLHKKHYVSEANLEAVLAKYQHTQEKLKHAEAQQSLENHSLNAVSKGMYFTGNKTEGIERDLYAELDVAQKKAQLNDNRVKIYENLIKKLTLKAPFDGKITKILKSAGNTTGSIIPIIYIEKTSTNKNIIAYLTQDEVIHIGASGNVRVYIPSSGKTYHGKILSIDRTDGFIDLVKAQYRWRDFQIDRSAMVTIAMQPSDQNVFNKQAFSGMPAIVYFSKHFVL